MLRPSGIHRIFLYDRAIDMRKSFEGLSQLIEVSYPGKLLTVWCPILQERSIDHDGREAEAGELIGVKVLDHIIIGDSFHSFASQGLL